MWVPQGTTSALVAFNKGVQQVKASSTENCKALVEYQGLYDDLIEKFPEGSLAYKQLCAELAAGATPASGPKRNPCLWP